MRKSLVACAPAAGHAVRDKRTRPHRLEAIPLNISKYRAEAAARATPPL